MSPHEQYKAIFSYNFEPTTSTTAPIRPIVVLGENTDVDTGTVPETVWRNGGLYQQPTTATTVTISSSSSSDPLGGIGAQIVLVEGLNEDYEEIWEVINLNGTSTVTSTNTYWRVNFFRVVFSGSNQKNVGNITATVDSKVVRYIAAGIGLDQTAVYTVPKDHTLFLTEIHYGTIKGSSARYATISTQVYVPTTNTEYTSSEFVVSSNQNHNINHPLTMARVNEKSEICHHVQSVSTNSSDISGSFRGLLVYKTFIQKFLR